MPKARTHPLNYRTESPTPTFDKYVLVTLAACAYVTIIGPLISTGGENPDGNLASGNLTSLQNADPNLANRIFFPAIAAVAIILAIRNHSRLRRWPPHMICFFAYVAFAGASVLWAFRPDFSFNRFVLQMMLLSSIVLPTMLATRTADLMRGMFLVFAIGAITSLFVGYEARDGYAGFMMGKNALGEFSGVALLLALHEALYAGFRRAFGIIVVVIATLLLLWSSSKTSFALALVCPVLAGVVLAVRLVTRVSLAIIFLFGLLCYAAISSASDFGADNVSAILYGDPTFSKRTFIWDFAFSEIAHRPLFGWGYKSFWLVGTDAPSVLDAPGWIGTIPSAHNGYYDTMLELGYFGLGLLTVFILATLQAIGRVSDRDPRPAWLLLSLALYVIFDNLLETSWMSGADPLWVVFVIVAAETARHSQIYQRQPGNLVVRGLGDRRERFDTSGRRRRTTS